MKQNFYSFRAWLLMTMLMILGNGSAWAEDVTFDWSDIKTTTTATEANIYTQAPITLTFAKADGTNWPSENKEGSIRMYTKTSLTIQAAAGYQVTAVEFTATGTTYGADGLTYESNPIENSWTVSPAASEILLTATKNARFKTIKVTYTSGEVQAVAAAPSLTEATDFSKTLDVTITNNQKGATVYYTLDGTAPNTESAKFTEDSKTITLEASTTIKAMAVAEGMTNSKIVSATYDKVNICANLAEVKALASGTKSRLNFKDVVVTYVNGSNYYIQDESAGLLIYLKNAGYSAGEVLNGTATVTVSDYSGLMEITAIENANITKTTIDKIPVTEVTLDELLKNFAKYDSRMVRVVAATVSDALASRKATIAQGEAEIQIYEKVKNALAETALATEGNVATIIGFPGINNSVKQLNVYDAQQVSGAPIITRKGMERGKVMTFCSDWQTEVTGGKAYLIAGKTLNEKGEDAYIILIDGLINTAQKPYGWIVIADGTDDVVFTATNKYIGTELVDYNGLIGSLTDTDVPEGKYVIKDNKVVKCGTGCKIEANHCYIDLAQIPVVTQGLVKGAVILPVGDEATAISLTSADTQQGDIYNMAGQRVSKTQKGIYIINGKKILK